MSLIKELIIIKFILISSIVFSQNSTNKELEQKVLEYNDKMQYEKSITLITTFIDDENCTDYNKYFAYLLKAYTYKRLFNYEETLHNLNLALDTGIKSDKKEEVINTIKAEKAFVYFDTHKYNKASELMKELSKSNYKYLDNDVKAFIIMQEGYLLMLNKKYPEAEKKLDASIAVAKKYVERNLPNIYGKKVELYNAMGLYDKRDKMFEEGMKIAKKYKIIKYEMYLYEVLKNEFHKNKDYKNAFDSQQKFDSLEAVYDINNINGKIQLLEKQIEEKRSALESRNQKNIKYFLMGVSLLLFSLFILTYYLLRVNKQKKILAEKEISRIHRDIEILSKEKDEKGVASFDISNYNLSDRQVEIVQLIQQGKSNKEIANILFISENTVKYHLKIIYSILDIEHRLELNFNKTKTV